MSEAIAEMVLPGTYIEVRSEGLIGAGAVSTGNLGIVGTAAAGPRNQVVMLSSYAQALDAFGPPDPYTAPIKTGYPLTLVRALQLAFAGGAGDVWAVRIANGDPTPASLTLTTTDSIPKQDAALTAINNGSWGNQIAVELKGGGSPTQPTWTLTLSRGTVRETFGGTGTTMADIVAGLKGATSQLVTLPIAAVNPTSPYAQIPTGTMLQGGSDQADASAVQVAEGLAMLESQPVNLVHVAGMGSGMTGVQGAVLAHLEATENAGHDRIAVLGAVTSGTGTPLSVAPVVAEANSISDDRVVLVAPGALVPDAHTGAPVALPPPYLAAALVGMLSSLAPHVSLTNKTVPIDRLDVAYNTAMVKALLNSRVAVVRPKIGYQVVKGITTDTGAFTQISVRRVVDFAKAGVRSGADPYIGKLNNARVRAALKATLDGFLSQMVLDEMLVSYQLDVTATRAQEIQGIAAVAMTLQPTFSIDFIRVTITLQ